MILRYFILFPHLHKKNTKRYAKSQILFVYLQWFSEVCLFSNATLKQMMPMMLHNPGPSETTGTPKYILTNSVAR
jgi:hypothetical protein